VHHKSASKKPNFIKGVPMMQISLYSHTLELRHVRWRARGQIPEERSCLTSSFSEVQYPSTHNANSRKSAVSGGWGFWLPILVAMFIGSRLRSEAKKYGLSEWKWGFIGVTSFYWPLACLIFLFKVDYFRPEDNTLLVLVPLIVGGVCSLVAWMLLRKQGNSTFITNKVTEEIQRLGYSVQHLQDGGYIVNHQENGQKQFRDQTEFSRWARELLYQE
jgi:hypothetical protein